MSGSDFVPNGDLPQQQKAGVVQVKQPMSIVKPSQSDSKNPQSSRRFGPEVYLQEFGDIGNPLAPRIK